MEERIRKIELDMVSLKGDVSHIKDRVDNGISATVTKIFDKINVICPLVQDNAWWVGRIKGAVCWVTVIAVGGGIVALFFHFVKKGIGV